MTTTQENSVLATLNQFRSEILERFEAMDRKWQSAVDQLVRKDAHDAISRATELRLTQAENKLAAAEASMATARQDSLVLAASVKRLEEAPARREASLKIWITVVGIIVTLLACASGAFFATLSIAVNLLNHFMK